ncbi:MAG TPA: SDR family NAD(P)-dependent oxidoreductase [Chryseolinea sp.]|nr:SDR family NAD(P)-dependent oxidoreductase [Chryseolinea sp.]
MNKQYYTLITGASQGLGKALAIECARRNMNLILVSLPEEGLSKLSAYLKAAYNVNTIAIEIDLCGDGHCQEVFNHVAVLGLQVNMLINNAGIGGTRFFSEECVEHYERQIRLNVLATTIITRSFLEMLKRNAPSHILNVGSLASFFSLAKKQVYGGTKSYIYYFSKSLRRELMHEQVFVSVVCPGGMYTNDMVRQTINGGNYIARASGMMPEDVAPITIDGLLGKREVILPGVINKTFIFLNCVLPRFVVNFLEIRAMKRMHSPCQVASEPQEKPAHVFPLIPLNTEKIIA